MKNTKRKNKTIDDLAGMIQKNTEEINSLAIAVKKGFEEVHERMATKDEINTLKEIQKDMFEELNATHDDVRYVRNTVNKLVQNDIAQDVVLKNLSARVHRLERKAGIAR